MPIDTALKAKNIFNKALTILSALLKSLGNAAIKPCMIALTILMPISKNLSIFCEKVTSNLTIASTAFGKILGKFCSKPSAIFKSTSVPTLKNLSTLFIKKSNKLFITSVAVFIILGILFVKPSPNFKSKVAPVFIIFSLIFKILVIKTSANVAKLAPILFELF